MVRLWFLLVCSCDSVLVRKCVLMFLNVVVGLWNSFSMWLLLLSVCSGIGKLNVLW